MNFYGDNYIFMEINYYIFLYGQISKFKLSFLIFIKEY